MSKARPESLHKEIHRLATVIHQKHSRLDDAGKKELSFIHKHLRKAAKAIERNVAEAKPPRKEGKKSTAKGAKKPRAAQETPAKTKPAAKPQEPA